MLCLGHALSCSSSETENQLEAVYMSLIEFMRFDWTPFDFSRERLAVVTINRSLSSLSHLTVMNALRFKVPMNP